jgi:HD-GYP domain-containing protein (c-di-GMP phosphodiesterase class II)
MERLLREQRLPILALIAACALVPAAVLHFFGSEDVYPPSWVHFAFIAVSATIAACAAIALTYAGAKRDDGRTVLLGTAFTAMTAMLAVHGLSTPGIIAEPNGVIALAGAAVLPLGGAVLALSTLPALRRPRAVKPLLVLDGVLLVGIIGLGIVGLTFPSLVPPVPETGSPAALVLLAVGLTFFAALGFRAARTYLLTRRRADFVVIVGVTWLGIALFPVMLVEYGHLAFWIGHVLELAGVAMVGGPVALDLYRGSQSRPLVGDLRAEELVTAEEAFLGPRVRALMVRLAEKDAYTEGHTRRVALRAVLVGEALGLSAGRLRNLAMGGLLHDMGKLSVPNAILQKPGPLDNGEFSVIKRHPEWGNQLIAELGGFPEGVRRLVLDHHERLDGGGYPRGRQVDDLDLETRILTVCDVYDALISERVYREAWSTERALGLLRKDIGAAFDPDCVVMLEKLLAHTGQAQAAKPIAA